MTPDPLLFINYFFSLNRYMITQMIQNTNLIRQCTKFCLWHNSCISAEMYSHKRILSNFFFCSFKVNKFSGVLSNYNTVSNIHTYIHIVIDFNSQGYLIVCIIIFLLLLFSVRILWLVTRSDWKVFLNVVLSEKSFEYYYDNHFMYKYIWVLSICHTYTHMHVCNENLFLLYFEYITYTHMCTSKNHRIFIFFFKYMYVHTYTKFAFAKIKKKKLCMCVILYVCT